MGVTCFKSDLSVGVRRDVMSSRLRWCCEISGVAAGSGDFRAGFAGCSGKDAENCLWGCRANGPLGGAPMVTGIRRPDFGVVLGETGTKFKDGILWSTKMEHKYLPEMCATWVAQWQKLAQPHFAINKGTFCNVTSIPVSFHFLLKKTITDGKWCYTRILRSTTPAGMQSP